ncbi:hypothetical protein BG616_15030 [Bacillus subtilis]|nr:hypothetical protein BG616_15030 [Bacillus subtilis]
MGVAVITEGELILKKVLISLIVLLSVCVVGMTPEKASAATKNITTDFSTKIKQNAIKIAYYAMNDSTYPIGTGREFASKVKTGGPWDYKLKYGPKKKYIFDTKGGCYNPTGEDLGNIHYGYVGRAAGFSDSFLRTAAGAYQIYSGTSKVKWYKSYFDDPKDQKMIDLGLRLYKNNWLITNWSKASLSSKSVGTFTVQSVSPKTITNLDKQFDVLSDKEKKEIRERAIKNAKLIKAGKEDQFIESNN